MINSDFGDARVLVNGTIGQNSISIDRRLETNAYICNATVERNMFMHMRVLRTFVVFNIQLVQIRCYASAVKRVQLLPRLMRLAESSLKCRSPSPFLSCIHTQHTPIESSMAEYRTHFHKIHHQCKLHTLKWACCPHTSYPSINRPSQTR